MRIIFTQIIFQFVISLLPEMRCLTVVLIDALNEGSFPNIHLRSIALQQCPPGSSTVWLELHKFQFAREQFYLPHLNTDCIDLIDPDVQKKLTDIVGMRLDISANYVVLTSVNIFQPSERYMNKNILG